MRAIAPTAAVLLVAVLAAGAAAQQAADPLKAIQAFCKSPAFAKKTCGWADDAEQDLVPDCKWCGTMWTGEPRSQKGGLPLDLNYKGMSYWQYAASIPSLACQGKAVVRTVFKVVAAAPDLGGPTCADSRLVALEMPNATAVVRCELQLPAGAGAEAARALRGKEANCKLCTSCSGGGGCPHRAGSWYSDSFVVDLPGCKAAPKALAAFTDHRAAVVLNPGTHIILAKFEVCQDPGCFDAKYEAAKLKSAKACTKKSC